MQMAGGTLLKCFITLDYQRSSMRLLKDKISKHMGAGGGLCAHCAVGMGGVYGLQGAKEMAAHLVERVLCHICIHDPPHLHQGPRPP